MNTTIIQLYTGRQSASHSAPLLKSLPIKGISLRKSASVHMIAAEREREREGRERESCSKRGIQWYDRIVIGNMQKMTETMETMQKMLVILVRNIHSIHSNMISSSAKPVQDKSRTSTNWNINCCFILLSTFQYSCIFNFFNFDFLEIIFYCNLENISLLDVQWELTWFYHHPHNN